MKIGILTFHDGPNHGAFLQAWATFQLLKEAGHDVEIINYKNAWHHEMESGSSLLKQRNPFFAYGQWRKRKVFRVARHCFRLGKFTTDAAELRQHRFDCVVIGSDVVWNYDIFGYDPVFFGRLNTARRVAFSASFGSIKAGAGETRPPEMAKDLAAFDAIAVRDENSRKIVKEVLGRDVALSLDPTLLYDFSADIPAFGRKKIKKPYLLVYSYKHPDVAIARVRTFAQEHGLSIYCVGYPLPFRGPKYCSKVDLTVGPFEWVKLFADADAILTCTFHGVIFSLKSRKPFLYISNDKAHNRVSSLLDICGIPHGLKLGEENHVSLIDPNYDLVGARLEPLAVKSREWLLDNTSLST
jgi:hypothetical protein